MAAGSLLFGGCVLLPVSLIVDHPWTLHPTPQALVAATEFVPLPVVVYQSMIPVG